MLNNVSFYVYKRRKESIQVVSLIIIFPKMGFIISLFASSLTDADIDKTETFKSLQSEFDSLNVSLFF